MTELILGFILGVLFAMTISFLRWEWKERKTQRAAAVEARIAAEVERRVSPWESDDWMGPKPKGPNGSFQPIRHP